MPRGPARSDLCILDAFLTYPGRRVAPRTCRSTLARRCAPEPRPGALSAELGSEGASFTPPSAGASHCREVSDCVFARFYDSASDRPLTRNVVTPTDNEDRSSSQGVIPTRVPRSRQTKLANASKKGSFRDCHLACWRARSGVRYPRNRSLAVVARASGGRLAGAAVRNSSWGV